MSSASAQANGASGGEAIGISSRGQMISFASQASNLVPGDTNGLRDAFVRDRGNGAGVSTRRVSIGLGGVQPNGSVTPDGAVLISADGRIVAYGSTATNLVAGDSNGVADLFAFEQPLGRTERITMSSGGAQADRGAASRVLGLSADGRFVLFASDASNLVGGDTNGAIDVFVRDRQGERTERINLSGSGAQANRGGPASGGISADGRIVVFSSTATNLTPDDRSGDEDVFVRDRKLGTTRLVSRGLSGASDAAVSGSGRFIAFKARSAGRYAIFLLDRSTGGLIQVSRGLGGTTENGDSSHPVVSRDGRFVAFVSAATNLVAGDTSGASDVFAWDRVTGHMTRVSVSGAGAQANAASGVPAISPSAEYIAFVSRASNLVGSDTNGAADVFVRYPELEEED
ncbi:MAG: hypothetical protein U0746_00015 [Gemmataceae bacterium]